VRSNPPGVELFYAAKLVRLEACGVSYYVLNGALPPFTRVLRALTESGKLTDLTSTTFSFWLKLQEE
jgi:hypothetical protein